MLFSLTAIGIGAALGAILRWFLSASLNSLFPSVPPGTLLSNLIGGYLIGVAVAYLGNHPELSPQWRLFVITGFMGGLTTFSTFSAEVSTHLADGRFGWAAASIGIHVIGSVALTLLGIGTVSVLRSPHFAGG